MLEATVGSDAAMPPASYGKSVTDLWRDRHGLSLCADPGRRLGESQALWQQLDWAGQLLDALRGTLLQLCVKVRPTGAGQVLNFADPIRHLARKLKHLSLGDNPLGPRGLRRAGSRGEAKAFRGLERPKGKGGKGLRRKDWQQFPHT